MFSTVVLFSAFVLSITFSLAVWALLLRLGLKWVQADHVTTIRLASVTLAFALLSCAISVLFLLASPRTVTEAVAMVLAEISATIAVACIVISKVFKIGFRRAFKAWLPTLLQTALAFALAFLVIRPFLFEGFVGATNSMAPTILGLHLQGMCEECGKVSYGSPPLDGHSNVESVRGICDSFHTSTGVGFQMKQRTPDRFLAVKFFEPRRWDLVVFRVPEDPSTVWVKRLVGLPGESVELKGGYVWINGEKQTPPERLKGIQYLDQLPDWPEEKLWGAEERPVKLALGEYFVLGDFSAQSADSRMWRTGAPGYNPYAVPASHIVGVVTHTYWPPERWRIHR